MQTRERWAPGAVLGVLAVLSILFVTAGPAAAHGAPTEPVSRAAGCGPDGLYLRTPACSAAVAASGGRLAWDDLRVAGVGGRDREVIPDGKLCSAGLRDFAGLDEARADWPTTTLSPGAAFTLTYRTTIPHEGTFRLYLTRPGHDPRRPLRWADLDTRPFLTATDPAIVKGTYVMRGRLPRDLTGRHVIYTIWQNSSTADTYYSCSDVVFRAEAVAPSPSPSPSPSASPSVEETERTAAVPAPDAAVGVVAPVGNGGPPAGAVAGAAGVAGLTGLGGLALVALRRRTSRRDR